MNKRAAGTMRSVVLMISAAVAFAVLGCGRQQADPAPASQKVGERASSAEPLVAQTASATSPAPGVRPGDSSHSEIKEIDGPGNSPDALPPDVAVSVLDTLVTPGTVVEITATATPDVEEVALSDAIGHKQPLVFDSSQGLWRTYYRVPLRAGMERHGLSVTARNHDSRWRRVWLFLHVQRKADEVKLESVEDQ